MNTKLVLGMTFLLIAGILGSVFYSQNNELMPHENGEGSLQSNSAILDQPSSKNPDSIANQEDESETAESVVSADVSLADIRDAGSAIEALELIEVAKAKGHTNEAAWAEWALVSTCSSEWLNDNPPIDIDYNAWAAEKMDSYCSDWAAAFSGNEPPNKRSLPIQPTHEKSTINELLDAANDSELGSLFSDLTATSETPIELSNTFGAIGEALASDRIESSTFGIGGVMSKGDLQESLALAEMLTGCELFGGCDPSSYAVQSLCVSIALCQPSHSLYDLLAMNSSPYHMQVGMHIRDFLLGEDI